MKSEKKVNLFIIGAPKAGTTSLHLYLDQHPDIAMSPIKETNYFSLAEADSYRYCASRNSKFFFPIKSLKAYHDLFRGRRASVWGESSIQYLGNRNAHARLRAYNPNARFIALLRNPVERAYSHYLFMFRRRHEQVEDFSECIRQELAGERNGWWPGMTYVTVGFYFRQLEQFFKHFSREQVRIYLHEDFDRESEAVVRDVFSFTGVDPDFRPNVSLRFNLGGYPKADWSTFTKKRISMINRFYWQDHALSRLLRRVVPRKFYDAVYYQPILQRLVGGCAGEKPDLDPEIRKKLEVIFRDDILRLQDLLGRDLSGWIQGA